MDGTRALFFLAAVGFSTTVSAVNITVCDCSDPESIGLLDAELPDYCQPPVSDIPILKNYKFYIKEEPHAHWDGFICRSWVKTKNIEGFFFGGYDTVFTTSARPTNERECWEMVNYHSCLGNPMVEEGDIVSFTAAPVGDGAWMQNKIYGVINCVAQRVTLRKDCLKCPITSPFGILSNDSQISATRHHDAIIVWNESFANISDQCNLKEMKVGTGLVTRVDEHVFKLVDNAAQLEFFYFDKLDPVCNRPLNKLKNLDTAYLHVMAQNWSHIYNVGNKDCLNINLEAVPCVEQAPQEFRLEGDQVAINNKQLSDLQANCLAPTPLLSVTNVLAVVFNLTTTTSSKYAPTYFHVKSAKCHRRSNFRWNSVTLEITCRLDDKLGCLTMTDDHKTSIEVCRQWDSQRWVFGIPGIPISKKRDDNQPLFFQHHQYTEHQAIVNENILEGEIKRIYCANLQIRKFTTQLLAESNGILAARANKLPMCQRLKVLGDYFLVQQCVSLNISVGVRQTKCGFEPSYDKWTIGRDGYSLHPAEDCFWPSNLVVLNDKTYKWDQQWVEISPTAHFSTLRLTNQFVDLVDNEAQYSFRRHTIFETPEYEQTNSVNEIINSIHETNANSLSALLVNEHHESRFWDIGAWATRLQLSLISVCAIVLAVIVILILLWKYKSRLTGLREILEHFAVGLQERRRQQRNNVLTT